MRTIDFIIRKAKNDKSVLAVALFGSYARGEPHKDLDLCIFLIPQKYTNKELSHKKMEYLQDDERYDVQVFQQLPIYIQIRILKEAKILYCKNEDDLYDMYFKTLQD